MVHESRFKPGIYLSQSPSKCSIVLNNVFKTHNNQNIFNGVNLIAHSGKICAILGEINSGKSMLLSCLVGGDKVDKGHIWVLGGQPRTKSSKTLTKYTGYMPQEFCLYKTMTVLELFAYFGNLYNINHKFILWRISYYKHIFTLPPINSTIKKLSFSEKRMISFMIAVFHRPRLVVLDEPTIGLDIFKKNQIWKYLHHMISTWKPTVVVATNNIEEAFSATKIAYLKNRKIIFEREVKELHRSNPNKSIDAIIEDLYISLTSINVDKNSWINSNQSETPHNKKLSIYKQLYPRSSIWKFKTIIIQNIKFLTKNFWMFVLLCVIPLLQVYLHCIYYGTYPKSIPIAVYNQETDCGNDPCKHIEKCSYYSCHFLNILNQNGVTVNYFDSEFLAKNSITKGSTLGFMKVSKNYTVAIVNSITQSSTKEREELLKSNINFEIDMSSNL
ncbi:ABC transporter G family member 23-like [Rhopalosiphum padi]|uniref:ABC transporter G family member 23-like n=1 Tax=Rhopalosiphum padi TaxID=40932 RepID=UPI00298D6977|nr:ABC transporter G family member 23-like [Rhopalosiphum padi]